MDNIFTATIILILFITLIAWIFAIAIEKIIVLLQEQNNLLKDIRANLFKQELTVEQKARIYGNK